MGTVKHAFGIVLVIALLIGAVCHAEDFPVTSAFGWRIHPISGEWKFHSGVDLGYDYGTMIPALFDGTIVQSGDFSDGYGKQVLIYHEHIDSYSRYAHMSEIYVSVGEYVSQGTVIGLVGSTGYSTGPHLHLEYIVRAEDGSYVYTNPLDLWN